MESATAWSRSINFHSLIGFLDQRKQSKMQWLQNPKQRNLDNLNNIRREASRHFKKKKEYLKAKIDEIETNRKISIIRVLCGGINGLVNCYEPRLKEEKGNLVAAYHSIVVRRRKHFSQLLNVPGVNDVRQTDIHTTEPLVPAPSVFEVELTIEKLKSRKSPGIDQIQAELIKAGG